MLCVFLEEKGTQKCTWEFLRTFYLRRVPQVMGYYPYMYSVNKKTFEVLFFVTITDRMENKALENFFLIRRWKRLIDAIDKT
jgi:hypothetical protein